MADPMTERGSDELRAARAPARGQLWAVALFSLAVNALMLTGPLYMLNVYDRVLGSRSYETLIALSVLVAFLYACMGLLDGVRGRVMGRVGAAFQARLDARVFAATVEAQSKARPPREALTGTRDLESVRAAVTSPAAMAAFDLPFAPLFVLGIFVFHPWMGWLALVGGAALIAVALVSRRLSAEPIERASNASHRAELMGAQMRSESETVRALGMRRAVFARWADARGDALEQGIGAADVSGSFTAATKALRLLLQSAMLGLGALLVLRAELTPGAMIAGSILLGRALAPIELLVGQWAVLTRGRQGWESLSRLLTAVPAEGPRTALPRPRAVLEADQLTVVPPGGQAAALRLMTFRVEPGQAVGVIGPSGAGKSTLARAITGLWPPAAGSIRLDGAALDQYAPDVLGALIGYLPQRVDLFEGTIAENIARMAARPEGAAVVAAARRAAAHEMILGLADGYDTRITAQGGQLSGGQMQRIGLARAFYGDPVMLVLDEPNSNLDNEGSNALNAAIREARRAGCCVFVMAHRPAAIQECDTILMIEDGGKRAFGPKEEVLQRIVANHAEIARANAPRPTPVDDPDPSPGDGT
ncbi:MAG: type I secretion system permease/ATPase [Paracoccaceae bacterium]